MCFQTGAGVCFHPTPALAVRDHLPPMESATKDIFLVIYSSRLFPSHWGVFVPSSEGSDAGILINVIGDPSVGFEHEFKRDYGAEDTRRVSKTLLLGKVASEHVMDRKEAEQRTENVPKNTLEDIALSIPPPSKSLRRGGSSVSFQATLSPVTQEYRDQAALQVGVKVEIKNCQSWLRDYVVVLVEKKVLEASALEVVDGAPKISSMNAVQ